MGKRATWFGNERQIVVLNVIAVLIFSYSHSLMEIEKKWTQPIHNRGLIMNQFILIFENRIQV